MQHLLDVIAGVVQPWTDYYASSSGIETTVMFLHLGGMVAAAKPGLAGPMAPADGLYLVKVNYPGPFEGEQE